jgi:hypothetical protein
MLYRFHCSEHSELLTDPGFRLVAPGDPAGRWVVTIAEADCPTGGTACAEAWMEETCTHRVDASTHECNDENCWNFGG